MTDDDLASICRPFQEAREKEREALERNIHSWLSSVETLEPEDQRHFQDQGQGDQHPADDAESRPQSACFTCLLAEDAFIHPFIALADLADMPPKSALPETPVSKSDRRGNAPLGEDEETPKASKANRVRLKQPDPKGSQTRSTNSYLKSLSKPFYVNLEVDYSEVMTQETRRLYERLDECSSHVSIVPVEVRDQIMPLGRKIHNHSFRPPCADAADQARSTLYKLREIMQKARASSDMKRYESGWNVLVHHSVLDLVFNWNVLNSRRAWREDQATQVEASARWEEATHATIFGDSVPILETSSGSEIHVACSVSVASRSEKSCDQSSAAGRSIACSDVARLESRHLSKKVDYVVALDLADSTSLAKMINNFNETSRFGRPGRFINQTCYAPLEKSLIAMAIGTKSEHSTSSDDALLQLGIWTAAWHRRMYALRESLVRSLPPKYPAPAARLPPLPLIHVIGHHWTLYFAHDNGDSATIYKALTIGSTDGLLEIYTLLASLQALQAWVLGAFRASMESWFLCTKREGTASS